MVPRPRFRPFHYTRASFVGLRLPHSPSSLALLTRSTRRYKNSRHVHRWYQHFTLVICVVGIPLYVAAASGIISLKLLDDPRAIGLDFWATLCYAVWTFVMMYLNLGYSLMTLRMAMRTLRSSGAVDPITAENNERSTRWQMIASTIPMLTIDVPLVISSLLPPHRTDNGFGVKGVIFVVRIVHVLLAILGVIWTGRGLQRKTRQMFKQVTAIPLDPRTKQQVDDVRNRVLAGQRSLVTSCMFTFMINVVVFVPVWYIVASTYFQPIG